MFLVSSLCLSTVYACSPPNLVRGGLSSGRAGDSMSIFIANLLDMHMDLTVRCTFNCYVDRVMPGGMKPCCHLF